MAKQKARTDLIALYKDDTGEWRWSRRSAFNGNIIAASCEGYKRPNRAVDNIERTQKGPYVIVTV